MRIVFVCTTNVWGSAMADLMARTLLAEWDPDRQLIQVESVGVRAQVDASIPLPAQRALAELGLKAGGHRARWMRPETLAGADLVLTMGAIQRDAALGLNPRGLRTTFTLLEAARLVTVVGSDKRFEPNLDAHARAVVAAMAAARRFHPATGARDDLPDLIGEDSTALNTLARKVHCAVCTVLRSLLLPECGSGSAPGREATVSVA